MIVEVLLRHSRLGHKISEEEEAIALTLRGDLDRVADLLESQSHGLADISEAAVNERVGLVVLEMLRQRWEREGEPQAELGEFLAEWPANRAFAVALRRRGLDALWWGSGARTRFLASFDKVMEEEVLKSLGAQRGT